MSRTITSHDDWDALPVGAKLTATRKAPVGAPERQLTLIRSDEEGMATLGITCIAGGLEWSMLWLSIRNVLEVNYDPATKPGPDAIADAEGVVLRCIQEHEEKLETLNNTPLRDYRELNEAERNPDGPDKTIIVELLALGWTPPALKEG